MANTQLEHRIQLITFKNGAYINDIATRFYSKWAHLQGSKPAASSLANECFLPVPSKLTTSHSTHAISNTALRTSSRDSSFSLTAQSHQERLTMARHKPLGPPFHSPFYSAQSSGLMCTSSQLPPGFLFHWHWGCINAHHCIHASPKVSGMISSSLL